MSPTTAKSCWNERYAIGIPQIDQQHRQFCEIIDKLSQIRRENNPDLLVKEVIVELKNYARYHFEAEERLLSEHAPENLQSQQKLHRYFIKKVEEFEIAYQYKNIVLSDQMHLFLKKWFQNHISMEDPRYVEAMLQAHPELGKDLSE